MSDKGIKILSAGAPKTGVARCAEAFRKNTGIPVSFEFTTTPTLKETINSGSHDVNIVVAPIATIKAFDIAVHTVPESSAVLGSVKTAVTIRKGAVEIDLASKGSLKQALLMAKSIVYNEASSGQHIASIIKDMGIEADIADKVTITKTGAQVMQYLDQSLLDNEFGFSQATEIQVQIDKGCNVKLLGTLPKEVAKVSTYKAALLMWASNNQNAKDLIDFMASKEGQLICRTAGL